MWDTALAAQATPDHEWVEQGGGYTNESRASAERAAAAKVRAKASFIPPTPKDEAKPGPGKGRGKAAAKPGKFAGTMSWAPVPTTREDFLWWKGKSSKQGGDDWWGKSGKGWGEWGKQGGDDWWGKGKGWSKGGDDWWGKGKDGDDWWGKGKGGAYWGKGGGSSGADGSSGGGEEAPGWGHVDVGSIEEMELERQVRDRVRRALDRAGIEQDVQRRHEDEIAKQLRYEHSVERKIKQHDGYRPPSSTRKTSVPPLKIRTPSREHSRGFARGSRDNTPRGSARGSGDRSPKRTRFEKSPPRDRQAKPEVDLRPRGLTREKRDPKTTKQTITEAVLERKLVFHFYAAGMCLPWGDGKRGEEGRPNNGEEKKNYRRDFDDLRGSAWAHTSVLAEVFDNYTRGEIIVIDMRGNELGTITYFL
jgi:hypothetical protein